MSIPLQTLQQPEKPLQLSGLAIVTIKAKEKPICHHLLEKTRDIARPVPVRERAADGDPHAFAAGATFPAGKAHGQGTGSTSRAVDHLKSLGDGRRSPAQQIS